jgi:hypothetical protein
MTPVKQQKSFGPYASVSGLGTDQRIS